MRTCSSGGESCGCAGAVRATKHLAHFKIPATLGKVSRVVLLVNDAAAGSHCTTAASARTQRGLQEAPPDIACSTSASPQLAAAAHARTRTPLNVSRTDDVRIARAVVVLNAALERNRDGFEATTVCTWQRTASSRHSVCTVLITRVALWMLPDSKTLIGRFEIFGRRIVKHEPW
jgi:hypothetical protein